MTFKESVFTCFRKYFTFSGRASRSEYWWFFLFVLLTGICMVALDKVLFGAGSFQAETVGDSVSVTAQANGPLDSLFGLATFLPMLAAGWRRMHDTGRSGVYLFYPMIAFFGLTIFLAFIDAVNILQSDPSSLFGGVLGIVSFVSFIVVLISPFFVLWWLTRPSQPGQNLYGPNPHEVNP